MAANNFTNCDAFTAAEEGGYTDNPQDPGNWTDGKTGLGTLKGTKYGIAAASYPELDIPNLTPAQAAAIREQNYWVPVRGEILPAGLDLMVYDQAVNSGNGRAAMLLQAVLGVAQDGGVGPHTLAAVTASDPVSLINQLAAAQEAFYRSLPAFLIFGAGWLARVARRHQAALVMAHA
jgi:lysozyme family protein